MEHSKTDDMEFVFEDGKISDRTYYYAKELRQTLHAEYGEDSVKLSFKGMEREVTYAEIGQAFLDRTLEEYNDLAYWRVLHYIKDDIPDISDDTVKDLLNAFHKATLPDWGKGDNQAKINRIKKVLYDVLGDEEQTEKAFDCIAKHKYNVTFEAKELEIHKPYQVITNAGLDGGIDEKLEYTTLEEAITAGKAYLADDYLGFAVLNHDTKEIERVEGDFSVQQAFGDEILRINGIVPDEMISEQAAENKEIATEQQKADDTKTYDFKTEYRQLSRLQSDCDYFLGNGAGHEKHLSCGSVENQIARMQELWDSFPNDKKPEWLSKEDIDGYAEKMLAVKNGEIEIPSPYTVPTKEKSTSETTDKKTSKKKTNENEGQMSLFGENQTKESEPSEPIKLNSITIDLTPKNEQKKAQPPKQEATFKIEDESLGEGGLKCKFKANIAAIETLKTLEVESRTATAEEKLTMSQYVGWGGLANAFDESKSDWANEFAQLKSLLTEDEYNSARASTLNAFYTTPTVIDSIYSALESFGFEGGNVLEPSCGVGNFISRMPQEMRENSNVYGVELDSLTGRLAKAIYTEADIQVKDFEKTEFQNGCFDVAVGNVPFGDLGFTDKTYGTSKLHDFFFAQTLDKVKEGGIVAFVTSTVTLDKQDDCFRKQLAEKADLIGAIRLPNTAFKANANTEVTSDIIFLQKRSAPPEELPDWVNLGKKENGLTVNKYFADHPDMVLGDVVEGNKLYGKRTGTMVTAHEGTDLKTELQDAVLKLSAQISDVRANEVFKFSDIQLAVTADELRPFSFFKDGKRDIYLKGGTDQSGNYDVTKVMDTKSKDYGRMSAFIEMRDTVRELLKVQAEDRPEKEIQASQQKLSTQYDDFYKKYGLLHSRKNRSVLRDDCSYNLLLTLEKEFDKDKLIAKSDIFTKRTVKPSKPIEHVDTALEALAISMAETAKVDLAYMSKLTDMSQELLISELKGEIFLVPNTEEYQSASEYLSGDIYEKLAMAKEAAKEDGGFAENVKTLEAAVSEPLKAGDIDVKIGATWIPKELYQQFMYEIFQTPRENRDDVKKAFWVKPKNITVDCSEHTNTWHIENKRADCSVLSRRDFGSKSMNAYEIMEHLLNLKEPKVHRPETYIDQNGDEKERRVVDVKATKIIQQKAAIIKQAFKDWIFKDPERAVQLVEQ